MRVSLRPVSSDDDEFLFKLFCSSVGNELNALAGAQRDMLLRMQFNAQVQTYDAEFPKADHQIILLDDKIIGRVLVERAETEHRGVDIALLPEYRSGGIGRMLIQELLDEASRAGKPFRISVVRTNPALHLYDRLGFKITGENLTHYIMEWVSSEHLNPPG